MHTSFLTIVILFFLALASHTPTCGMTFATQLGHPGIKSHICKNLSKDDMDDFKLVCKDWLSNSRHWNAMPDSVEKEYDILRKKNERIPNKVDKNIILFSRVYENDHAAVQWIIGTNMCDGVIVIEYNNDHMTIYAPMFALLNNNVEMARPLIEEHATSYQSNNWKEFTKQITISNSMQRYLYPSDNRDLSFLPYLLAIWMDNAQNLERLFSQKLPTHLGQNELIKTSISEKSTHCFNFLLSNASTKKIIKQEGRSFFQQAIQEPARLIAQTLLDRKLYNLNAVEYNATLLDHYYHESDNHAYALLRDLKAKTWKELQAEKTKREKKQIRKKEKTG